MDGLFVDVGDEAEAEVEGYVGVSRQSTSYVPLSLRRGSISLESEGIFIMPTLPLTLARKSATPPVDWKGKASGECHLSECARKLICSPAHPVRTVLERQQPPDVIEISEGESGCGQKGEG